MFDEQAKLLQTVQQQMITGFKSIYDLMKESQSLNVNSVSSQIPNSNTANLDNVFNQIISPLAELSVNDQQHSPDAAAAAAAAPAAAGTAGAGATTLVVPSTDESILGSETNNSDVHVNSEQTTATTADQVDRLVPDGRSTPVIVGDVAAGSSAATPLVVVVDDEDTSAAASAAAVNSPDHGGGHGASDESSETNHVGLADLSVEEISMLEDGEIEEYEDNVNANSSNNGMTYASKIKNKCSEIVAGIRRSQMVNPFSTDGRVNRAQQGSSTAPESSGRRQVKPNQRASNSNANQGNRLTNGTNNKKSNNEFL